MLQHDLHFSDTPASLAAMPPMVAVVILNWNGQKYLEQFLPSVLSSTYPRLKIVLADNASTDGSVAWVQQHYPIIEVVLNKSNDGFANGYNTALKQVSADYYVLLNSDVEVTPSWIEPIIDLMESNPNIAAAQPAILSWHQKNKFEYAGAAGGWIDRFGYPFARGRVFEECEDNLGQYNTVQPCFWASGAAFFVKASLFHEAKGFDGYFFAHQEEIDLCWRLQRAGYQIFAVPTSVVYHVGGGTLPKGNQKKTMLNFRNNLIMMYKNLPFTKAITIIPFRLGLDALAAYRAIFKGDAGFFMAVVKSHVQFILWIFLYQSRSVFSKKGHAIKNGWYNGSIVLDYFIRKKKTFSEIIKDK
jgi:GT2 family glycosyltransferase